MSELTFLAKAGALNRDMLNDYHPCLISSAYISGVTLKWVMMVHPILKEIRYEIWQDEKLSLDTPFFDNALAEFNRIFAGM
jgi:hypothetical protein